MELGHLLQPGGVLDQPNWYYVLVPMVKRELLAVQKANAERAQKQGVADGRGRGRRQIGV